jgi:hypothetical protein
MLLCVWRLQHHRDHTIAAVRHLLVVVLGSMHTTAGTDLIPQRDQSPIVCHSLHVTQSSPVNTESDHIPPRLTFKWSCLTASTTTFTPPHPWHGTTPTVAQVAVETAMYNKQRRHHNIQRHTPPHLQVAALPQTASMAQHQAWFQLQLKWPPTRRLTCKWSYFPKPHPWHDTRRGFNCS